ncbi:uncharacterized protein LOC142767405 isoform X1 [Rhipicephalus microplus]|uniref:uncharacterized protein LOC142767405 isoform X1 n=1 Tax=Rhipicephalus microplus TaxID=6941 RepID=UPI003F6C691A
MNSLYREHLRNFARNVCSFRCNVLTGHRASMQLYGAARCTCGLRPCGLVLPQNTAGREGKHASAYIIRPYSHKATVAARTSLYTEGDAKIAVTLVELVQN